MPEPPCPSLARPGLAGVGPVVAEPGGLQGGAVDVAQHDDGVRVEVASGCLAKNLPKVVAAGGQDELVGGDGAAIGELECDVGVGVRGVETVQPGDEISH